MAAAGLDGLLIRALEPDDAEGFAKLQNMPGYRFGTLRPRYVKTASLSEQLANARPDDLSLGAFLDGRLVGSAWLHRFGGRRHHAAVLGMGVADDLQRKGIGTILMKSIIDAADNWMDIRRIELTVFADNDSAIRLYERFGFEREGTMRAWAFRDGAYFDVVAMARLRGL